MAVQISQVDGWRTLKCSVQDCQNQPAIALQVFARATTYLYRPSRDQIAPPDTGEPVTSVTFTPCLSDEGVVREYLGSKGYTPKIITVIPKETIEDWVRIYSNSIEAAQRRSKYAGGRKESR